MITEQKIKQVKKLLRRGVPEGELITDLKDEGFSDQEIEKVFASARGPGKRVIPFERPLWYMISVGFIILGVTIILGPPLWLRSFEYLFLIVGLAGIVVRAFLSVTKKN